MIVCPHSLITKSRNHFEMCINIRWVVTDIVDTLIHTDSSDSYGSLCQKCTFCSRLSSERLSHFEGRVIPCDNNFLSAYSWQKLEFSFSIKTLLYCLPVCCFESLAADQRFTVRAATAWVAKKTEFIQSLYLNAQGVCCPISPLSYTHTHTDWRCANV